MIFVKNVPIDYPDDGAKVLDILIERTQQDDVLKAKLSGATLKIIEHSLHFDHLDEIVDEEYLLECIYTNKNDEKVHYLLKI